jgi:Tfp pilus assembly protein PilV
MGRLVRPFARRLRQEAGVTLLEMLIASAMLLVVLTAVFAVMLRTMRSENTSQQFSQEIQTAETGLARMMREVRQSTRVVQASANTIRFVLPGTTDHVVQYECDVAQSGGTFRQCTRVQAVLAANADPNAVTMPAASTGIQLIQNLTNGTITAGSDANAVFHYQAPGQAGIDAAGQPVDANGAPLAPTYVQGKIIVPAAGDLAGKRLAQMSHNTVLSSGAYLRSADIGS